VVFSVGTLIMGWDFIVKLMRPMGNRPERAAAAVAAE